MAEDLYGALGVERSASVDEIKRAYRALARKYHPDKAPNDEEAARIFKAAAEAWQVLGDPELRARYDRYGVKASRTAVEENPGDVFEEIFGSRRERPARAEARDAEPRPRRKSRPEGAPPRAERPREEAPRRSAPKPVRGEDLKYRLSIDLAASVAGTERTIGVTRRARCGECGGSGAAAGAQPVACTVCAGSGSERVQQGFFAASRTCSRCAGLGRIVEDPCNACRGTGLGRQTRPLVVSVPPGVSEGTRLKIAGEGEPGAHGGPPGDLFVVLEVEKHPFLEVEGIDLSAEVPIRFAQAALGASIEVPTLEGVVRMRVPAGSQSGRVFRLKGKGLRGSDGRRGDQRVRIVVDVPESLTDRERELLEELDELDHQRGASARARDYTERLATLEPSDAD